MNRTRIDTFFALFTTCYSVLHAAQNTIVVIHSPPHRDSAELIPLNQPDVQVKASRWHMSPQRERTIRTTLHQPASIMNRVGQSITLLFRLRPSTTPPRLPHDLTSLVIEYAQPSDEEEVGADAENIRFMQLQKTRRRHICISAYITATGYAEFIAACYNPSLETSGSWQLPLAYTGIGLFGTTFMSSMLLPFCMNLDNIDLDRLPTIQANIIHGLLGSATALCASLAPVASAYAPQCTILPLAAGGGIGIIFGSLDTALRIIEYCRSKWRC